MQFCLCTFVIFHVVSVEFPEYSSAHAVFCRPFNNFPGWDQ